MKCKLNFSKKLGEPIGHFEIPLVPSAGRHDPIPWPYLWWVVEENGIEISREKVFA